MNKNKSKKLLILIGVLAAAVLGVIMIVNLFLRPMPENKRNISETDASITVTFNNEDEERTPIIRTYKEEEYNKLSKNGKKKIIKTVEGNIEGDIPAVELKDEKAYINIGFIKDGRPAEPDILPEIKIEQLREDSNDIEAEMKEVLKDKIEKENGLYTYKLDRYAAQYDKYFMHFNLIKINYQIDGEKYISVFALNTTNADKDVDWFKDNEELENSINIK